MPVLLMQTFLPYRDIAASAAVLDRQRLGKQRVEGLQILRVRCGLSTAWRHHPAVLMWKGHERALRQYVRVMCMEWSSRGYTDNVWNAVQALPIPRSSATLPRHFTRAFCRSHQSNLLRKDPEHYRKYFKGVPDDLPYVWPVRIRSIQRRK